jgi:peptidoglycan hydrolase CwlO-like protein
MFIMKVRNTNMKQKTYLLGTMKRRLTAGLMIVLVLFLTGVTVVPRVTANTSDQIQRLQQENANNKNIVAQLQSQATSYKDAIDQLQSQINNVQAQIDVNTAKQNEIQANIVANEAELLRQRAVLGENIRVSYVESRISTIEMLATSKNLSDFVDKEEYRTVVKKKIQTTLVRINELQNQLKEQKVQVERLLAEQQSQRAQLASARAEQSRMLAYNQSQVSDYNKKTKDNNARIQALIAAQRRANNSTDGGYYFLRFAGPVNDFNPGEYPYKNAGFSMQLGPCSHTDSYPDAPDRWGYCTRQCVSYAAWAVEASGRRAPMYYGNAKEWVSAAYRDGVEVSRVPEPGDIAISTSGTWGHAMYVEKVEASRIYVSQYNAGLDGEFSYQWRNY